MQNTISNTQAAQLRAAPITRFKLFMLAVRESAGHRKPVHCGGALGRLGFMGAGQNTPEDQQKVMPSTARG